MYYVFYGVFLLMEGIGLEDINIVFLIKWLYDDEVKEVIIVINVIIEGEVMVMYLLWFIKLVGIIVICLVYGLFVGSDIEYVDEIILLKVVEGCWEI